MYIEKNPHSKNIDVNSYIGKVYSRLTIVNFLYYKVYSKSRAPIFNCKCECGTYKEVSLWDLKRESTKSCGCLTKDRMSLTEGEAAFNATYGKYKIAAEKRGYEFNLTPEQFKEITQKNCFYCGTPPSNKSHNQNDTGDYIYSGIDRKDNNIGYEVDNCLPCCKVCNRAKSSMSFDEFLEWIQTIKNYDK